MTLLWEALPLAGGRPEAGGSSEASADFSCNVFLHELPGFEYFLYVLFRALSTDVPHWCIFYVCYWVERSMYKPISRHWDVTLSDVSFLGAERNPRVHARPGELCVSTVSEARQDARPPAGMPREHVGGRPPASRARDDAVAKEDRKTPRQERGLRKASKEEEAGEEQGQARRKSGKRCSGRRIVRIVSSAPAGRSPTCKTGAPPPSESAFFPLHL
ncbi:UNVERIFIED_CONTAM: hypothetical protein HHA_204395 [Hammondia hammondi]|eukprot:XP_008887405.1 hypothetical protein HHA_204395 [Hammondia hammondi]